MVKVKFVAHLMRNFLVPNLLRSKHFDPDLSPIEKSPGLHPVGKLMRAHIIFGWVNYAEFDVIWLGKVQLDLLPKKFFPLVACLTAMVRQTQR